MTTEQISEIYHRPLLDLIYDAATVHRNNNDYSEVQISSLISIKTGGCSEDCAYCPQSAAYDTGVKAEKLMSVTAVLAEARNAKAAGATRFCRSKLRSLAASAANFSSIWYHSALSV